MKNKAVATGATVAAQLRAKRDFHRRQAKLSFERKIEIVVRLQKLAATIGKISGRKPSGLTWRWPAKKYQNGKMYKTKNSRLAARS
jgi:hypothetical protein